MSSEPASMPDDPAMFQDLPEAGDQRTNGRPYVTENASVQPREWEPEEEDEIPLNAEEATVLVLSFLRRMGKSCPDFCLQMSGYCLLTSASLKNP